MGRKHKSARAAGSDACAHCNTRTDTRSDGYSGAHRYADAD